MSGYQLFIEDAKSVLSNCKELHLIETDQGVPELNGTITLQADIEIVDSYEVRIVPTIHYPKQFPHVFETAGRIPLNIDWHVHGDGHFCLCTVPEEMLKCKRGFLLQEIIEEEIKPFLFNQTHRRKYGFFINERSHGFRGELEFYKETLHLRDVIDVAKFFSFVSKHNEPGRTENCFCGSNKKYRNCHRENYRTFSVLSDGELNFIFQRIIQSKEFKIAFKELKSS